MLNQLFAFYFHIIIETNNTCMHRIDVYIHLNMHWQIDRLKPMNKICFFFSIIILFVLLLFFFGSSMVHRNLLWQAKTNLIAVK